MKSWWCKWSYEVPLFISEALWDVLVMQFAAWLDRLTLRRIIAFIPILVLVLAYAHSIPIPPELMLVGDVLAYIDIFSVILLLGMLSRVAAIFFVIRQSAERAMELTRSLCAGASRLDLRHRRESGARGRKRSSGRAKDDDGWAAVSGVAWA